MGIKNIFLILSILILLISCSKKEIEDLLMQKVNLEEIYSEAIQIWNSIEKKDEIDKSLEFFTKLEIKNKQALRKKEN